MSKNFIVREVGTSIQTKVEAHNDYHAVAEVAGCEVSAVCLPIWRAGRSWFRGEERYSERCYMPLDNTGRQWLVTDDQN